MKKVLWLIVCLMTMVLSANAHNVHYPTYTEDGITYVQEPLAQHYECGEWYYWWSVLKVDKPNDKTITIPYKITIKGEQVVIWGIRENAFESCVSLDSLIISDGINLNGSPKALRGLKLEYLYYSHRGYDKHNFMGIINCKVLETTEGCAEKPFWSAIGGSLEKLIIRENTDLRSICCTFNLCQNLKTIVCYKVTPPDVYAATGDTYSCEDANFQSWQWEKITLYVPRESLEKYYFDRVWGEIDNIYAIDEMPIEESLEEINGTIINDDDDNVSANDSIFVYYDGEFFTMKDSNDSTICDREVKLTESTFITICYALEAVGKKLYIEAENFAEENDVNNSVCETSSISSTSNKTHSDDFWHSFSGIMVDKPNKGVYIKNGKKYIIK